ncbi:MAG: hypothetical protein IJ485_02585 [Lachnospiraceae bacterium]|nr:hypothetical protein [Lachnospiraceae bacterium]
MAEQKQVKYDIDGYEAVTSALRELLNQYPGLSENDEITFATLGEDSGKAMFPVSSSVIETEKRSVTGKVTEVCIYPFYVIYRASGLNENRKAKVKEWLDNLGKWLEQKKVLIDDKEYQLAELPPLTDGRKFLSISRQTASYLDTVNENQSENWTIYIYARYQYEYYK